jgi:hypothetical protein
MDTPRCWNCTLDLSKVGLLRIGEAARKCGVGPTTVRRWMEEGDVEWLKLPNGFPMIVADTLPTGQRVPGSRSQVPGFQRSGSPGPGARNPEPLCHLCGNSAERSRILLDQDQAAALCRVQKRTLAGWVSQGWVKPEQGYFYLDSLFQEPRRHRDLDVRR